MHTCLFCVQHACALRTTALQASADVLEAPQLGVHTYLGAHSTHGVGCAGNACCIPAAPHAAHLAAWGMLLSAR